MMNFYLDDSGEERVDIYRIRLEDVDRVKEMFPGTECKHDYDCCGNFYYSRGEVIHVDEIYGYALVKVKGFMNV